MRQTRNYLPKLLEYIELVNKIPETVIFPTYNSMADATSKRLGKNYSYTDEDLIESYKIWFEIFPYNKIPQETYDLMFGEAMQSSDDPIEYIIDTIDLLVSVDHGIRTLAYAVRNEHFNGASINEDIKESEYYMPDNSDYSSIKLSVNENGFIEIKTNEFLDFIKENNIEARRVRSCVICNKCFWAFRKDKWTCSKECGNIFRQRNWQSENKEDYNLKRRQNYAYKKLKKRQKEQKNNGTL